MNIRNAKAILEQLAQGANPMTGEMLPPDHVCNQGEVVRAFYAVLDELNKETYLLKNQPENAGKPWTRTDDTMLCRMYNEGTPVIELSLYFKRTTGSISSRLKHLGILPPFHN